MNLRLGRRWIWDTCVEHYVGDAHTVWLEKIFRAFCCSWVESVYGVSLLLASLERVFACLEFQLILAFSQKLCPSIVWLHQFSSGLLCRNRNRTFGLHFRKCNLALKLLLWAQGWRLIYTWHSFRHGLVATHLARNQPQFWSQTLDRVHSWRLIVIDPGHFLWLKLSLLCAHHKVSLVIVYRAKSVRKWLNELHMGLLRTGVFSWGNGADWARGVVFADNSILLLLILLTACVFGSALLLILVDWMLLFWKWVRFLEHLNWLPHDKWLFRHVLHFLKPLELQRLLFIPLWLHIVYQHCIRRSNLSLLW